MGIKVVGSKSTALLDQPLAKTNYLADGPFTCLIFYFSITPLISLTSKLP